MASEASRQRITVAGRYFMNSPTTPGQNSSGMNTARVVAVEAITGQLMRAAALTQASRGAWPWRRWRSASSLTTMAPSTSMPATRISANSTTMLRV